MNLREREYWTTRETAMVLGRSAAYWAKKFDEGCVRGYRDRGRHVLAESAREFLAALVAAEPQAPSITTRLAIAEETYRHWNRNRTKVAG